MPDAAPDNAAPEPDPEAVDGPSDPHDGTGRDAEADRLVELAAQLDPVPPDVTEAARRAWRARFAPRRRARPEG